MLKLRLPKPSPEFLSIQAAQRDPATMRGMWSPPYKKASRIFQTQFSLVKAAPAITRKLEHVLNNEHRPFSPDHWEAFRHTDRAALKGFIVILSQPYGISDNLPATSGLILVDLTPWAFYLPNKALCFALVIQHRWFLTGKRSNPNSLLPEQAAKLIFEIRQPQA